MSRGCVVPARRSVARGLRAAVVTAAILAPGTSAAQEEGRALLYPEAKRDGTVDTYHGTEVADPYRWLEDGEAPETAAWLEAQDELLATFVADVAVHEQLEERIASISRFDGVGVPRKYGERTFYGVTPAGEGRSQYYVLEALSAEPRRLVDPRQLFDSEDTRVAAYSPSPDGRYVVLNISERQSRWHDMRVLDVDTGELLPETLTGFLSGRSALGWAADGSGFYYVRFEIPEESGGIRTSWRDAKLYFHQVGTGQSEDQLVYERPDQPRWLFAPRETHDGRYLVITVYNPEISETAIVYRDLEAPDSDVVELLEADAQHSFEGSDGTTFFVRTSLDAPRNRVVGIDVSNPAPEHWREIIPEREEAMISVAEIGDRLVVRYIEDARAVVRVFDFEGAFQYAVEVPAAGRVGGLADNRRDSEAFYSLNWLYDPGSIYRLDVNTGESELFLRPELAFDPDDYATSQVFYSSHDGTRVPMFVLHRKDVEPSPDTPLLMYAYGAAGWPAFPWFQPHLIAWLDLGGVYALPGVRGGGEYGTEWWEAGRALNKQVTIDDFIAATEWLIDNGYTSASRFVANGGSASGSLAMAAMMQRPELYGAGLLEFPALDKLRYHLFGGWPSEFGTVDDPDEFEVLYSYSPLHNLSSEVCYPPTIVQVGARDEITSPAHGYKFVAAMQASQPCANPALLKIAWEAGHSAGATPAERARTGADELAFLIRVLRLQVELAGR